MPKEKNKKQDAFSQSKQEGYEFLNSLFNNNLSVPPHENPFFQKDKNSNWIESDDHEGELSVDVYQTEKELVLKSAIAGIKPEDIDISINNDMLTIRGKREMDEEIKNKDYFYRECYWGKFSRSIIMPMDVKTDKIKASIKNGILTIRIPKAKAPKSINISVKEE